MKNARFRLIHRIISILFALVVIAAVAYVCITRTDGVVAYGKEAFKYIATFFTIRQWDNKSFVVIGCLAFLIIVEPFWLLINITKKKRVGAYLLQILLPLFFLVGLVVYHYRKTILYEFNGGHSQILIYAAIAAVTVFLLLLITYPFARKKTNKKMAKIEEIPPVIEEEKAEEVEPAPVDEPVVEPVVEEKIGEEPVIVEPIIEDVAPVKIKKEQPKALRPKVAKPASTRVNDKAKYGAIIRRTFVEKLGKAPTNIKNAYNEVKSELLSYGVKARVSKTGESFRYKKVILAKLTAQGKIIKINLALDPKAYSNTTIPVQDIGMKKSYIEIPALLKIKSTLSVKRAKKLVADVMAKHGLVQGEVVKKNHAKSLKEVKA